MQLELIKILASGVVRMKSKENQLEGSTEKLV
jgi:hypothetical protein